MGSARQPLLGFFRWFGPERSHALPFICSDMWKRYLRVAAKKAGQAIHVLDRFHIASHLSKAIDEVRAKEAMPATLPRASGWAWRAHPPLPAA